MILMSGTRPERRRQTDLRNTTLHDQKVRIVNVELDTLEEELNRLLGRLVAIKKILGYIWEGNLIGH